MENTVATPDVQREKVRERQRRWREGHADGIADYQATHRDERRDYQRQYYAQNIAAMHDRSFASRHGITRSAYNAQLSKQRGGCYDCGTHELYENRKYFIVWRYNDTIQLLCTDCAKKRGNGQI